MPMTSSSLSTMMSAPTPFLAMSSSASKTLASGEIVQAVWPFWSSMSLTVIMLHPSIFILRPSPAGASPNIPVLSDLSIEITCQVVPVEPLGQGDPGHGAGHRLVQGLVEGVGHNLSRTGEGGDRLGRGDQHLLSDAGHVGVHGAAEDAWEAEHVVDR